MTGDECANVVVSGTLAPGTHPSSFNGRDANCLDNLIIAPDVAYALRSQHGMPQGWNSNIVAHSLRAEGFDASEDGTGRGTPLVVTPFDTTQITSPENRSDPHAGDPCHPLTAEGHAPAIAFQERGRKDGRTLESQTDLAYSLLAPSGGGRHQEMNILAQRSVRRLTPIECERIMGFPDNWTLAPHRNGMLADGPRYKLIGNSIATTALRWVGRRIQASADRMPPRQQIKATVDAEWLGRRILEATEQA